MVVAVHYIAIQVSHAVVEQQLLQKRGLTFPRPYLFFSQVGMGVLTGFWDVRLAPPIIAVVKTSVQELNLKKIVIEKA